MFEQNKLDAYRRIHADESLKEKILSDISDMHTNHFPGGIIFKALCPALCLVIILAVVLPFGKNNIQVFMYNSPVSEETILIPVQNSRIAHADENESVSLPFTLNLKKHASISASDGSLQATDNESGEFIAIDSNSALKGSLTLWWDIDGLNENTSYSLQIENSRQQFTVTLYYDESANEWMICGK